MTHTARQLIIMANTQTELLTAEEARIATDFIHGVYGDDRRYKSKACKWAFALGTNERLVSGRTYGPEISRNLRIRENLPMVIKERHSELEP